MNNIKIMTDSASDIPEEIERALDIKILSFHLTIDEGSYQERIDFTNMQFYEMLFEAQKIPTTSQITSIQFLEEFAKIQSSGYSELIYVSINSLGSNTYNAAIMAREQFFEKNPSLKEQFKIHIIDSRTYTIAYGYPVIQAAKKVKRGACSSEIIAYLRDWFDSVEIYFAPYTLEFVKKSGRVSCAAAFVGELMGLRPIISIIDGETKVIEKVRGDKSIIPALVKNAVKSRTPQTPYLIVKGTLDHESVDLAEKAKKQLVNEVERIYNVGASIAINAGPKVIGIIVKGVKRNKS